MINSTVSKNQISSYFSNTKNSEDDILISKRKAVSSPIWIQYVVALLIIATWIVIIKLPNIGPTSIYNLGFYYTVLVIVFIIYRIILAYKYHATERKKNQIITSGDYNVSRNFNFAYDKDWPLVSFIIPCKNEEDHIAETIKKCFDVEYPKDKIEAIVIDDGSTDNTAKILRGLENNFPALKVIHFKENLGKRIAMATGFKFASGDILFQLDSDSFVNPKTFYKTILPFQDPKIGAVCAHAIPANRNKNLLTKMQAAYYMVSFKILKAAESTYGSVFCCSGCASAYRREAVLPIIDLWQAEKFLGKKVTWGDDRSLTSWVLRQGYKTIFAENVKAYTYCPESLKVLVKQQTRWKKSWIINTILLGRNIWKIKPLAAITYYYPLALVTILTPIVAFRALVYLPLMNNIYPYHYFVGIVVITSVVFFMFQHKFPNYKYYFYYLCWSVFNMVFLSFTFFYALIKIQNRGWGTR